MYRLVHATEMNEIPEDFRNTPVSDLILYHNSQLAQKKYTQPELLIGMCMDSRKTLNIPENFAFIMRSGGANVRYSEFNVSYAIGVGGIDYMALMGHTQCGMVNLPERKEQFIQGLCDHAGWSPAQAEEHFMQSAPLFEIGNEVDFILSETKRLATRYPKIKVAPLLYKVEDNLLYWIDEHLSLKK